VQGMSLKGNLKRMNPNMEVSIIEFNGNPVVKSVFDGEKGYMEMQGQKKDMDAAEIGDKKDMGGVFRQLNYSKPGFKMSVDGIEKVDGQDAYKLTITAASGKKSTEFYDVKSGLLKKVETIEKTAAGESPAVMEYKEYRKFGNLMLPASWVNQVGPQTIEITVTDLKINEAVSAADFK
jgi:zinc protease